jgi:hypothetical protein
MKRFPLLGDANTFLRELLAYENERCSLRGPYRGVNLKATGATKSVSYQLLESSVRETVKIEPKGVKLKNLRC